MSLVMPLRPSAPFGLLFHLLFFASWWISTTPCHSRLSKDTVPVACLLQSPIGLTDTCRYPASFCAPSSFRVHHPRCKHVQNHKIGLKANPSLYPRGINARVVHSDYCCRFMRFCSSDFTQESPLDKVTKGIQP